MRWHQRLVAQKWDFSKRRGPVRPGVMRERRWSSLQMTL
jgi:hypothetical protein